MTTSTRDQAQVPATMPTYSLPQRVTQARVLRSEWTKLRTQPSTVWALLTAVVLIIGFGVLYSLLRETRPRHRAAAASFDPVAVSLAGCSSRNRSQSRRPPRRMPLQLPSERDVQGTIVTSACQVPGLLSTA